MNGIKFTAHARDRLEERGITVEWIGKTIGQPELVEKDPQNSSVTRSYRVIAEAGGRRLRVAHRQDGKDTLLISSYFDV